ncbi:MAG: amino acid permease, partial [Candidatus Aminicenantes bacterium]|nr:amino acid permease [Candidatus Aminicenantes bacterium]
IGAGIFMNSSESAKFCQSSAQLLLVWAAGGVIAFLGGLCFAELGALFPQSGGQVIYLDRAFSPWLGFFFGWTLFSTIQTGAIAAVSTTCARFVGTFVPMSDSAFRWTAAGIIWLLTAVNILGVKPASWVQNIFTILKISALVVLIVVGVFVFKGTPGPPGSLPALGPLFPSGVDLKVLSALGLALMPALFSYGGWQNLNFVAGEVKNPARSIPLAIISGVALVVVVYILSNVAYVRALPLQAIAGSAKLASDAFEAMVGPWGGRFISAAIIVSTFGITNVFVLTGARVYQVMAEKRMFVPAAARVHRRFGTPHVAILFQAVWASGLLLSNTYGQLLQYVTFGDWIFFGLTALALIVLRRKMPGAERPYRTWGYPATPLIFLIIAVSVVINVFISSPVKSFVGTAIILAGLPMYLAVRRKDRTSHAL